MGICQYPDLRSRVENIVAPLKESNMSWIFGKGSLCGLFSYNASTCHQQPLPVVAVAVGVVAGYLITFSGSAAGVVIVANDNDVLHDPVVHIGSTLHSWVVGRLYNSACHMVAHVVE